MSLEIEKPLPLMVGDKAYYSLTSYDPVTVEVEVPFTTEEEVGLALGATLERLGATHDMLSDREWMAKNFQGMTDEATVRRAIRASIDEMNAQMAEGEKIGLVAGELAARLRQAVPAAHIARYRESVRAEFEQQIASEGMGVAQFLARSGASQADLETMLDEQARQAAEREAALDAFAREKGLSVDEGEFGGLLGIPEADMAQVVKDARTAGHYDRLRDAALHAKAALSATAEAICTYRHETEEQARARVEQVLRLHERYVGQATGAGAANADGSPGLHLV